MGEVREFRKYEIVLVDVNGRQFIGKSLLEEDGLNPYLLINPALILFQPIMQQTKIGSTEFGVITQVISLGLDELNIEDENILWGVVTNKKIIDQYEKTFEDQKRIVNA